jgi:hypothetical protein
MTPPANARSRFSRTTITWINTYDNIGQLLAIRSQPKPMLAFAKGVVEAATALWDGHSYEAVLGAVEAVEALHDQPRGRNVQLGAKAK